MEILSATQDNIYTNAYPLRKNRYTASSSASSVVQNIVFYPDTGFHVFLAMSSNNVFHLYNTYFLFSPIRNLS